MYDSKIMSFRYSTLNDSSSSRSFKLEDDDLDIGSDLSSEQEPSKRVRQHSQEASTCESELRSTPSGNSDSDFSNQKFLQPLRTSPASNINPTDSSTRAGSKNSTCVLHAPSSLQQGKLHRVLQKITRRRARQNRQDGRLHTLRHGRYLSNPDKENGPTHATSVTSLRSDVEYKPEDCLKCGISSYSLSDIVIDTGSTTELLLYSDTNTCMYRTNRDQSTGAERTHCTDHVLETTKQTSAISECQHTEIDNPRGINDQSLVPNRSVQGKKVSTDTRNIEREVHELLAQSSTSIPQV